MPCCVVCSTNQQVLLRPSAARAVTHAAASHYALQMPARCPPTNDELAALIMALISTQMPWLHGHDHTHSLTHGSRACLSNMYNTNTLS
mmetsp:Transcript_31873/g.63649  ORF Transcript_31873/g.63649 Transcript_31873/m.63649 type:complete len:89 (+) Transcript_31873:125-391(+)